VTDDELKAFEALAEAATPGPWDTNGYYIEREEAPGGEFERLLYNGGRDDTYCNMTEADFAFVAAARSAVPALVAEVRRQREELFRVKGELLDAKTEALNGPNRAADEERRRWYRAMDGDGKAYEGLAPEVAIARALSQLQGDNLVLAEEVKRLRDQNGRFAEKLRQVDQEAFGVWRKGSAQPLRPSREADEARGVYVRELSAQETSGDVTVTDPAKDRLEE
jgi:hypothetical protein